MEPSIAPIAVAQPQIKSQEVKPTLDNILAISTTSAQVLATVIAVEKNAANLPGTTKAQIVLDSVVAGSGIIATNFPSERVQQIAALINLFVSIFNTTGIFKKTFKT